MRKKTEEEFIERKDLKKLLEYSCSLPTGTTVGKRWRRDVNFNRPHNGLTWREPEWIIGEYYDIGSEKTIGIRWSWALDPKTGTTHRGKL